jgi:glycosyltransferase involved in cell wall biosynthesis
MPTYNGEAYLSSTLESIVCQDAEDIECIVVDSGSTDGTLSILDSYKDKLPIRIFYTKDLNNWVSKTNYALEYAQGEYVCFLHQDDLWFKNRITTMRKLTEQFPDVGFILHPSWYIDNDGHFLGLWQCPLPPYPTVTSSHLFVEKLLVQNFISIPAPLFKREIIQKVGGMNESLWYTADWDLWLKLASNSNGLYYPEPLSGFRIHPQSMTMTRSANIQDFREQLEVVIKRYLGPLEADKGIKNRISKVANFSKEVNIALAGTMHGNRSLLPGLIISFLMLGPSGWYRYINDSRIVERISARVKGRLISRKH